MIRKYSVLIGTISSFLFFSSLVGKEPHRLACLIHPSVDWYIHKIAIPEEYKGVMVSLKETKELMRVDKQWNLEDIEIHKTISDLIWKKEKIKANVRKARRNPFVIFKPVSII